MFREEPDETPLDERQKQVLDSLNQAPLRVIAGPGTGKTATVVAMYLHLIREQGLHPSEILLLTFSVNAAKELQRRVDTRMVKSYSESWISTFHSFAYRLVNRLPPGAKSADLTLMTGFQERLFIRFVLDRMVEGNWFESPLSALVGTQNFVQDVLWLISSLKQELVSPDRFDRWIAELEITDNTTGSKDLSLPKLRDLNRTYRFYEEERTRLGLIDFRDVIAHAVDRLESDAEVRQELSRRFRYLIVDEYQDVDAAQVRLLDRLTADHPGFRHLAVVGDPDQSIYSFRGTSPKFLTTGWQFGGTTVYLDRNYRSYPQILDGARRLLASSGCQEQPHSLTADRISLSVPVVRLKHEENVADEASATARLIEQLIRSRGSGGQGYEPSDIAVILRSVRRSARPFEEALRAAGIPSTAGSSTNFPVSRVVTLALCALRALADPSNDSPLSEVLQSSFVGLSPTDVGRLRREANRRLRYRAELGHRALLAVLKHACFLMRREDPTRWPLPWEKRGAESRDPVEADYPPFPQPAPGSEEGLNNQQSAADQLQGLAAWSEESKSWEEVEVHGHPWFELLSEDARDSIYRFTWRWTRLMSLVDRISPDALAFRVFQDLGVMDQVLSQPVEQEHIPPLRLFLRAMVDLGALWRRVHGSGPSLMDTIPFLDSALQEYVEELEPPSPATAGVRILTVHASKGLEFPVVFSPAMVSGRFPVRPRPRTALLDQAEREWLESKVVGSDPDRPPTAPVPWSFDEREMRLEEGRLAYVAATRARDLLVLTHADRYEAEQEEESLFLHAFVEAGAVVDEPQERKLPPVRRVGEALAALDTQAFLDWEPWTQQFEVRPSLHESASSLRQYLACPRQYYYGKLLHIRSDAGIAAARGTAFHEALQKFHDRDTEARWRANPDQAESIFRHCCEEALTSYLGKIQGHLEQMAERDQLEKLFRNYLQNERDNWFKSETLQTEASFTWKPAGLPDFVGRFDRVIRWVDTGAYEVIDYKTGSKKTKGDITAQIGLDRAEGKPATDVQLAVYFFAVREAFAETQSKRIRRVTLCYPKAVMKRPPRLATAGIFDSGDTNEDMKENFVDLHGRVDELRSLLGDFARGARSGTYPPKPFHDQYTCAAEWGSGCAFASICSGRIEDPEETS